VTGGYPEINLLIQRVQMEGYEAVSRDLHISGNAIRKYIERKVGTYPKPRLDKGKKLKR